MLQRIRDGLQGQKWLALLIMGLIGLTFVFWGGSGALDFTGMAANEVARVNGEEIPAESATRAWSEMQANWAQQFGTDIPEAQRAQMQDDIIEGLVREKLLDQRFQEHGYAVHDGRVLTEFERIPAFQGPDGKFDPLTARQVLQRVGITERELYRTTRRSLLVNQLQNGIGNSYFLMPAEAKRLADLENEEREVAYVRLSPEQFTSREPIDDAAIQAYYDANGDRFMTNESVALEYAELRLEQVAAQVVPTEEDLRNLYEDSRQAYVVEERRRARHILIPIENDDDAAALKQAEAVLAEARDNPDFAEVAKKYSKDSTASDGGELGFVQRSDFPGPFGDTLFGMNVGDIAGPVKSQFGYHLIKLEEIQAGEAKPFEEVRAELDAQYREFRSAEIFGDRQEQIAETIERGETDLDKIAREHGLTRGSIQEFLRGGGAAPLGSSVDLQQVVFSDATLNQGRIGGPVGLGEDRLVIVKVTTHRKAEVKPLAEVRDDIVDLLREERAAAAAKAAADEIVAKLQAGEKLETLASAAKATVEPARFVSRGDPSIPAALRNAVFEAPRPGESPVIRTTTLDDGSAAVYVFTRTRVGDTSANPQLVQQQNVMLVQRAASGDIAAYISEARRKAEVSKNLRVFE